MPFVRFLVSEGWWITGQTVLINGGYTSRWGGAGAREGEGADMAEAATTEHHPLLRRRDGHEARVTFEELFFDLVYAFAVTQLSHALLHHLTLGGAVETLVLWFAVWLGWQYTCWVTNWFDPEAPAIRWLLFGVMLLALVMSAALPEAFGERGLLFAGAYALMQVGRTLFVLRALGPGHALSPNFRRILFWVSVAAVFWVAGAFAEGGGRTLLWAVAVLCEYVSPMFGFPCPWLGRSSTREWTVEGGHMAERCQAFVLVALGETVVMTGGTLAEDAEWSFPILLAFVAAFLGSLAAWWIYFGTSGKAGSAAIRRADDPGRVAALFHYVHAILIAGIVVTAVGNELAIAHPDRHAGTPEAAVLVGGPAIYLLGGAFYKKVVYGCWPPSHLGGLAALAGLVPFALSTDLLMVGGLATVVMLGVGLWESRILRGRPSVGADAVEG